MSQTVTDTQVDVRDLPSALRPLREQILADLTMLAQIPAPTGEEEQRVRYVLDRFVEAGVPEVGPDEVGNAVGLLPGRRGERTILLVAHVDTIYPRTVNHNVTLEPEHDRVITTLRGTRWLGRHSRPQFAARMSPNSRRAHNLPVDISKHRSGFLENIGQPRLVARRGLLIARRRIGATTQERSF